MPASRNHVPLHTSHNPPYSKDRAAGMTGPSRQSSTGATGGGGGGGGAKSDKRPFSVDSTKPNNVGLESEEASKERKRKRKAKRAAQGQLEGESNAGTVKSEDIDMKEGQVVKSRPLTSSTIIPQSQAGTHNTSSLPSLSKPPSNAPQTQPVHNQSKGDSRLAKLEHKMEKQKMKLKEAEARAAADAEKLRKDAERIKQLESSVKELEDALSAKDEAAVGVKKVVDDHVKTIEGHVADKDRVTETLTEAVSCLICSDTLVDPHILSCGHFACRDCLKAWFRQPNAYQHDVGGVIEPTRDMSYRSKICHVCRSIVLRRPTKMYNVYSFLEPLGLISAIPIPTAPQDTTSDPWANSFPVEKQTYRLHDDDDGTDRCPSCLHEIWNNTCSRCDAEFSGSDEDDGFEVNEIELDIDDLSVVEDGDSDSESDGELGIARPIMIAEDGEDDHENARPRRGRGARVNIRNLQDILGESEDDTPARARNQLAAIHDMYDIEASDDEDMGGSESGSQSGEEEEGSDLESVASTEFAYARPRRIARRDQDRDEAPERRPRNFIDLTTGEIGGAGAPGTAQFQQRQRRRVERQLRRRVLDEEAMSDETDLSDSHDMDGSEGTTYDSQEDDGAVPRAHARARPRRIFSGVIDPEDYEDDEEESDYGGSFIDDEVEEDGDGDVASNDEDEEENDADEMIQVVSEGEEDGAGQNPNIPEIRRKRLEALVNRRRNARGNAGRAPAPAYPDSEEDEMSGSN